MTNPTIEALFITVVILSVLYLVLVTRLTRSLRERHRKIWMALGEPGFANYSIRNSNRLSIWILFQGKYKDLEDRSVDTQVTILRIIALIEAVLMLVIIVLRYS